MDSIYKYKGHEYKYIGVGRFKDSTRGWTHAVIYERDNHIYMREIKDFFKKFEDISSPLYADYAIVSSDGNIEIERGEVDTTYGT